MEEKLLQFGLNKEDGGGFIFSTDEEICPNEVESWSTNFNTGDITGKLVKLLLEKLQLPSLSFVPSNCWSEGI